MKTTKITLATVKKFIRENIENLYINKKSSFDGMVDCVMPLDGGFKPVEFVEVQPYNLGIDGAWFVGGSRDYFTFYKDSIFKGIEVSNSCGHFILSIK